MLQDRYHSHYSFSITIVIHALYNIDLCYRPTPLLFLIPQKLIPIVVVYYVVCDHMYIHTIVVYTIYSVYVSLCYKHSAVMLLVYCAVLL